MPLLSQEPLVNHGCLEDLYDIQQKIGDGHFADVNLCVCKSSNKKYAAKFIMKQRINTGLHGSSVSDIDREAFILANLQHENIVNLHEVFYREDSVVLILDLVTGGELFARVADCERLSEEEASNFVQQILLGVQHMHGLGIVHLDLKPENIMIEDLASRKIKIIDFGLARVLNPNESFQDMAGTPEFCAPEIVNFDPITFATDMWAVGVLTYILLTGISPFAGDTQLETFQNILDCIVDYSREEMQNVSDLAKDFIQKLLVKNPRKRSTVNECLQHPWIKPKDNKQSNYRRDSLISREKLSSLRHFIATNPNTSVLSLKNNNTEEQDKSPSSPTSPLSSVNINDRTRFSLPDNSVINKIQNTVLLDKIATESSSNQTLQNKQFCKKESNQNRNNSNSGNKIIKNEKVINHILQAKSLSAFKTNTSACSTNSGSPVVSHVNNSQNSTSNKSINNSSTVSGSWRVNFQNNIIGRLGAAFAAATGHVTTSTHHHILNEVDSSSDHQLSVPAKSTEVIVNKTNSLKSSKETNIKQSYSSFGAVSRAVKELEITANPMNNNNNSMTTTNTTINNNGNMADLKIVRRFQTLGMNQLAETTCVNRPLVNGYPNEKASFLPKIVCITIVCKIPLFYTLKKLSRKIKLR
ncbi:serine/threonine kinase [Schistosoma mansoni]|uniref:serine/threonine kinase n=1 Tax=Schistosoma mansoni TaxID=6183 RepID=UPI0001A61D24|nr:serine/threonine kinase [Schistosoma mansoni]|eukprot:XP_018650995.1 serine/threonine kinase [Schistosoma mansoni]